MTSVRRRRFLKQLAGAICCGLSAPKLWADQAPLAKSTSIPHVVLNNDVRMPMLGFGTNTLNGEAGIKNIVDAISAGYRLIDTAHIYGNEKAVGEAIRQSGVDRETLFLTSKLWIDDAGYNTTLSAFERSIEKLGVGYLDLYLIHRPKGDVEGSWKAMEALYAAGKIKAIGLSNFEPEQLEALSGYAKVIPAINQIESHVFFQQKKSYPYLKQTPTQMQAWSPFAAGRNGIFTNAQIARIGEKYNKTNAQICLRWQFQRGVIAIPRSSQKAHMIENLNIFDFELSAREMASLSALDLNVTQFPEWA